MSDYVDKGKKARLYSEICFFKFLWVGTQRRIQYEIEFHIMEIMGKPFLFH